MTIKKNFKKLRKLILTPDLFFFDLFRKRLERKNRKLVQIKPKNHGRLIDEANEAVRNLDIFNTISEALKKHGDVKACSITKSLLIEARLTRDLWELIDSIKSKEPLHLKIYTTDGRYHFTACASTQCLADALSEPLKSASEFIVEFTTIENAHRLALRIYTGRKSRSNTLTLSPSSVWIQAPQPNSLHNSTAEDKKLKDHPIDAVYTWVDSSDPSWEKSWKKTFPTEAYEADRYDNNDQLRHSLRSINKHAPWIRNIFIISNCSAPSWLLLEHPRIHWVTHEDIFTSTAQLPTFNSHAIECCLHKIKSLSESFIYFNDDFFLTQPCHPYDFFDEYERPIVYFEDSASSDFEENNENLPEDIAASINSSNLIYSCFGYKPKKQHKHVPYALKKSILFELEGKFTREFEQTRNTKQRAPTDINVASFLFQHYVHATGYCTSSHASSLTTKPGNIAKILNHESIKYKFICINDGGKSSENQQYKKNTLCFYSERFSEAADWEKI